MLEKYYSGFYLEQSAGNNAFSFNERKNKKIIVPEIIEGDVRDLKVGEEIAFSEVVDGKEINCPGLKQFVYTRKDGKEIFIFDNHNHAFFFWVYALKAGRFKPGGILLHVDQHKDTREPARYLGSREAANFAAAFNYTQNELNVGNFIKPAVALNIFADVIQVTNPADFEKPVPQEFVLDVDLDIFAPDMAYIPHDYKIQKIKTYMDKATLITIATSPFFMDQAEAIRIIAQLF